MFWVSKMLKVFNIFKMFRQRKILVTVLLFAFAVQINAQHKTENVILITLDGVRPKDMFGGLDLDIVKAATKRGAVENTPLYKKYWAAMPEQRREKVMPFFWDVLMKQDGSIAGNQALGSIVQITNKHRFSYPGYSEILTGQAHDDVIKSNKNIRNPYPSVLEFLKRKLRLSKNQIAAFGSWDTIGWIVEHEKGTITTNAGYEIYKTPDHDASLLSKMQFEAISPWDGARNDAFTFRLAMSHLKTYRPRVLYISFDGTDDWAHDNRYDRVLQTLTLTDNYLQELWSYLQSQKQYKDKTTILIATDHGRGLTPSDWSDHGADVEGAQYIWLAAISPDSNLRGEWRNTGTIYQNQIAATMCRFLGLDYSEQNPEAGKAIGQLFTKD